MVQAGHLSVAQLALFPASKFDKKYERSAILAQHSTRHAQCHPHLDRAFLGSKGWVNGLRNHRVMCQDFLQPGHFFRVGFLLGRRLLRSLQRIPSGTVGTLSHAELAAIPSGIHGKTQALFAIQFDPPSMRQAKPIRNGAV
jgi:hypothetical protein